MKKIYIPVILLLVVGSFWLGYEIYRENNKPVMVGGDRDSHGCIPSAGYNWCPSTSKCQRTWEEYCEEFKNNFQGTRKDDLIVLKTPYPGQTVSSPLEIKGEARGTWFFEASFPVFLTDWDGLIIAQGIATAKSEWMTEDFVPFEAKLEFIKPNVKNNGSLILKKDNPSGLPQNDNALEIPVFFK